VEHNEKTYNDFHVVTSYMTTLENLITLYFYYVNAMK